MTNDLSFCINSVLLSLQLRDDEKLARTQALLRYADKREIARCIPDVLNFLKTYDTNIAKLCVVILQQMFYRHQETVVSSITDEHVLDLFRSDMDDQQGGHFLWRVLSWKALVPNYPFRESDKILKLLLRRSQQSEPKYIPCSALRWWLVMMWRDLPSMRPKYHSGQLRRSPVMAWLVHWLGTSREPSKYKVPLLQVLRDEIKQADPKEATVWVLANFFEALPQASPGLQLVFHFLEWDYVVALLPELLKPLGHDRLVTFWILLLSWTPVPLPKGIPTTKTNVQEMYFQILVSVMAAFRIKKYPPLIDTCLRIVASLGAFDENAAFSITLLSLLKPHFHESTVWEYNLHGFLHEKFMRFGADPLLHDAFFRLGFTEPHPSLAEIQFAQEPVAGLFPMVDEFENCMQQQMGDQQQQQFMQPVPEMAPVAEEVSGPVAPIIPPGYEQISFRDPCVGVRNYGNTCYLGSILQFMFQTDAFISDLMQFNLAPLKEDASPMDEDDYNVGKKILEAFKGHFATMLVTSNPHVGIEDIVGHLPLMIYEPNVQQDVTETIRFLLDKFGGQDQSLVRKNFSGEMVDHIQCQQCGNVRERPETFSDIVLTVPGENTPEAQAGGLTVQSLLDKRLAVEMLTGDDRLSCDSCGTRTDSGKWSVVTSPPQHAIFCLGRQSFDVTTYTFKKDTTYVDLSRTLLLSSYTYELYFVIIHQGKGADSGHYICTGRRSESDPNKWFKFDDSRVWEITQQDVSNLSAEGHKEDSPYVLFYRCTSIPPTNPPILPTQYVEYLKSRTDV